MQEKLAVTVLVITLALFALVLVLYNIIKENNQEYSKIVLNQHSSYDSRTIPYKRGDIVDRNGTYLAVSDKVYNLIIDARQIMDGYDPQNGKDKYLDATTTALATAFGYDKAELTNLILENPDSPYIRYARQLTVDQKEGFEATRDEMNEAFSESDIASEKEKKVHGVWFEEEYKRYYPYNDSASTVLGFASSDGTTGNGGIEQSYNSVLTGTNGREYGYLNDDSNLETVIKPAVNGNTVVSTIDLNVQQVVEKYIDEWMTTTGSENIGVVVMDPDTGEILAMATDRMYDLNNPRDLTVRYTQAEIDAMSDEEQMEAWYQLWRNYCVSDTYEPGSPSKIFTIAAALEEGIISGNETFFCDGGQDVAGTYIRCVNRVGGHGNLTVAESLMVSCNDVLMQIVSREGKEIFYKYQDMFGFTEKTGIDLPGEADTSGLGYTVDTAGPVDMATNSFGQNYNCTMVQMAAAYCSVLNGGSYYQPHVVKQILNSQGSVVKKVEPVLVRETVSQSTSDFIRDALFQTVYGERGTGKAAQVAGYELGGKTGTAEKLPRGSRNYVVSFCGFAPVDHPEVLVYVVVDQPHVEDQPHSTYASEIFAKIMGEILPYLNVFPETAPQESGEETGLPQEEGITDNTSEETGETPAEETGGEETAPQEPYPDEELVLPELGGSGVPDRVPGNDSGTETAQTGSGGEAGGSPESAGNGETEEPQETAETGAGNAGEDSTAGESAADESASQADSEQ